MEMIVEDKLLRLAAAARENSYSPYSRYPVGAALLGKSGRIYTGCNVENVSFGLTVCAERTAVLKAISEGEREFGAIAVVTSNAGTPCGACRQVLYEFTRPDFPVIIGDLTGNHTIRTIGELLPGGFGPDQLPPAK